MALDAAVAAFHAGDDALVRRLAEDAMGRTDADAEVRVEALGLLSRLALRDGDLPEATRCAQEAADAAGGDPRLLQTPVHLLAAVARLRGDLPDAAGRYRASIELNERLGIAGAVAVERRNLAYVELHLGHAEEARRLFAVVHGDADPTEPGSLLDRAVLAAHDGDLAAARTALDRLDRTLTHAGSVPDPDDAQEIARLREVLGG